MKLLSKEEVDSKRKAQKRDLMLTNERLVSSLKKVLKLQNDIEFDTEKDKKVKEFEVWCKDIQERQSKELQILNSYSQLIEEKKEIYYSWVEKVDTMQDKVLELEEELERLKLQANWNKQINGL